jgi:hypothetical protein
VRFGGVIVDRGCGLGTEVASLFVEIKSAHAVGTVRAVELHAALDALDSIGFHCLNCSLPRAEAMHANGEAAKVTLELIRASGVAAGTRSCRTALDLDSRGRLSLRNPDGLDARPHTSNPRITLPGGCIFSGPRAAGHGAGR